MFEAIAAMSLNRVIGRGQKIPWRLPEELSWFRSMTMGQAVVMGRKTLESIGKILPGRAMIVLSRSRREIPGVRVAADLGEVEGEEGGRGDRRVFICGGGEVYREALPRCSRLYLTVVKRRVEGDVYFPEFEDGYELVEEVADRLEFKILLYRNKNLPAGLACGEGERGFSMDFASRGRCDFGGFPR